MKWLYPLCCILLFSSCSPEVDVFAPEEEAFIVWSVLDPRNDSQFVRVANTFQYEGDAYVFAAGNDLSAPDLELTLEGNGQVLQSGTKRVNTTEGPFFPSSLIYFFETSGSRTLVPGMRYHLYGRRTGNDSILFSGFTDIPSQPLLLAPPEPAFFPSFNRYSLPKINLSEEYNTNFRMGSGKGFEIRLFMEYQVAGETRTARWGPTEVFFEPNGCPANLNAGRNCYRIPDNSFINVMGAQLEDAGGVVTYDEGIVTSNNPAGLSRAARCEVTAVDTFLSAYLYVNNPFGFGVNLLLDKPELTNISGRHIGVLGSINTHERLIRLDDCTLFKLGLTTSAPAFCD